MSEEKRIIDTPTSATGRSYVFTDEDRARAKEAAARRKAEKAHETWAKYLTLLEEGAQPYAAAKRAGLTKEALKKYREDPVRIQEEIESEAIGAEPVEAALREAALNGNVVAAGKWLEKRSAQRWTPPAHEVHVRKEVLVGIEAGTRLERIALLMERLQGRLTAQEVFEKHRGELADPNVIDV